MIWEGSGIQETKENQGKIPDRLALSSSPPAAVDFLPPLRHSPLPLLSTDAYQAAASDEECFANLPNYSHLYDHIAVFVSPERSSYIVMMCWYRSTATFSVFTQPIISIGAYLRSFSGHFYSYGCEDPCANTDE